MKGLLFCISIFSMLSLHAQPKAEGLRDSLNGRIKSVIVTFYKVKKDAKGNLGLERDYFSHHQEFIYDENNILIKRNFYEDKKKIREERDMIAFKKLPPGVKYDTSYFSTDTTDDRLITRYKDGKITEYIQERLVKGKDGAKYLLYLSADKTIDFYRAYVQKPDGAECYIWQNASDNPLNLKNPPNRWEKYNEKGHLILTVYNLKSGEKKSSGRSYKYDHMNNPVWIQFTEWNPATNKYEPTSEEFYEYKYRK